MLTVEQVKRHSEVMVKSSLFSQPIGYKLRLIYLKEGAICRLGALDDFLLSPPLAKKPLTEWDEEEVKAYITVNEWEAFTRFVNDNEILDEDMLLSGQGARAYQESYSRSLGTYKMLNHGRVEDIDVQANVSALYDTIVEAAKKL